MFCLFHLYIAYVILRAIKIAHINERSCIKYYLYFFWAILYKLIYDLTEVSCFVHLKILRQASGYNVIISVSIDIV